MYPLFPCHFADGHGHRNLDARIRRFTDLLDSRDAQFDTLPDLAAAITKRPKTLLPRIAKVIPQLWSDAIFEERTLPELSRYRQAASSTSFLTPSEVELTKKALAAGMRYADVRSAEIVHPVAATAALSGRWKQLLDAVCTHSLDQIRANLTSPAIIQYWLLNLLPLGADDPETRTFAVTSLRSAGIYLQWISNNVYVTLQQRGVDTVIGIPLRAYVGHQFDGVSSGGTDIAVHMPELKNQLPSRSFVFMSAEETSRRLYAHPGDTTLVINGRAQRDTPVVLTPGHFPLVFAGQTPVGRTFRLLRLVQQQINFTFRSSIREVAAALAVRMLTASNHETLFEEERTTVCNFQAETITGCAYDRAPYLYFNHTETENAVTAADMLAVFDQRTFTNNESIHN